MRLQQFIETLAIGVLALVLTGGLAWSGDLTGSEETPAEEVSETPPVDAPPPDSESGGAEPGESPQFD